MRHSTRAQPALTLLSEVDPAIAALSLWCTYRDGAGPTMTEGETIYVGPEFQLLPLPEQTGLISHHVLHVALRHSARRTAARERYGAGFLPEQYDLACDALVNELLLQGNHALPRPAVRASEIVALLPPEERPGNVLADWDCDRLYAAMTAPSAGPGGTKGAEIARYARSRGFSPDLKGADPDRTEAELWSGRIEQAMSTGHRAGIGIGTLQSPFGDLPRAVVPWEIRLRRALNKALAQYPRHSYRRPARAWLARDSHARQIGGPQPVFDPGLARKQDRKRLVIGLDTSSSIDARTLDAFAAEAISMVRRTGAEAHLLGFDTEVHFTGAFEDAGAIGALTLRRDGGTEFDPVLQAAQALDPSIIIVLTDLEAPVRFVPSAPVLWAVPSRPGTAPGIGEVLILNDHASAADAATGPGAGVA